MYQNIKAPVANDQITSAFSKGNQIMSFLIEAIGQLPIDITAIDDHIKLAQDIIESTSQLVETEIQQLKLAERLMVYGHRYIVNDLMIVPLSKLIFCDR